MSKEEEQLAVTNVVNGIPAGYAREREFIYTSPPDFPVSEKFRTGAVIGSRHHAVSTDKEPEFHTEPARLLTESGFIDLDLRQQADAFVKKAVAAQQLRDQAANAVVVPPRPTPKERLEAKKAALADKRLKYAMDMDDRRTPKDRHFSIMPELEEEENMEKWIEKWLNSHNDKAAALQLIKMEIPDKTKEEVLALKTSWTILVNVDEPGWTDVTINDPSRKHKLVEFLSTDEVVKRMHDLHSAKTGKKVLWYRRLKIIDEYKERMKKKANKKKEEVLYSFAFLSAHFGDLATCVHPILTEFEKKTRGKSQREKDRLKEKKKQKKHLEQFPLAAIELEEEEPATTRREREVRVAASAQQQLVSDAILAEQIEADIARLGATTGFSLIAEGQRARMWTADDYGKAGAEKDEADL